MAPSSSLRRGEFDARINGRESVFHLVFIRERFSPINLPGASNRYNRKNHNALI
jgi:hypothetical protein